MKDYLSLAEQSGISISEKLYDSTIKNYSLNKENNYIRIEYMNGYTKIVSTDETSLEEIKKEQEENFKKIKRKVAIHSTTLNTIKITLIGTDIFLSTASFVIGKPLQATAFILLATSMALNETGAKLYREMRTISWLIDNKDKVNAMIKDDVNIYIDENAINYIYPEEEVIYPKEMYEEGINLNNIESLTSKELKLIKIKTKQREKSKKNK